MLHIVLLFLLPACSSAYQATTNYTFSEFKHRFRRSYVANSSEHSLREAVFKKRIAELLDHNSKSPSWVKGVNHLTDWTADELKELHGYKRKKNAGFFLEVDSSASICVNHEHDCSEAGASCCSGLLCGAAGVCVHAVTPPPAMDWSSQLATAYEIIDQGHCGSCWAVSAAGVLTLHAEIVTHGRFKKVLSPQSMLTCTPNELECGGRGGCQGATAELAYDFLASQGSLGVVYAVEDEAYDPFRTQCASSGIFSFLAPRRTRPGVSIRGWKNVKSNDELEMMSALATVGPLAVSMAAHDLHGYESGVFDQCTDNVVSHAVIMMGYGKDTTLKMPYWNLRNSWGSSWGERGFFRLQRFGPGNEPCSWNEEPEKGIMCKDQAGSAGTYPERQWVCGACSILVDAAYPVGTTVPQEYLSRVTKAGPATRAAARQDGGSKQSAKP